MPGHHCTPTSAELQCCRTATAILGVPGQHRRARCCSSCCKAAVSAGAGCECKPAQDSRLFAGDVLHLYNLTRVHACVHFMPVSLNSSCCACSVATAGSLELCIKGVYQRASSVHLSPLQQQLMSAAAWHHFVACFIPIEQQEINTHAPVEHFLAQPVIAGSAARVPLSTAYLLACLRSFSPACSMWRHLLTRLYQLSRPQSEVPPGLHHRP